MKTATLIRLAPGLRPSEGCTLGYLVVGAEHFVTLEPAWTDNAPDSSAIPPGTYGADFLPRSASGRYRSVYALLSVPGRRGILIHAGNLPRHTKGCILIGERFGRLGGEVAILNSRSALLRLVGLMERQSFCLTILGDLDHVDAPA